jgi:hypothetical protein
LTIGRSSTSRGQPSITEIEYSKQEKGGQ